MKDSFCFCPLFSGSSGNVTYLSCGGGAVLIDCGKSGRTVQSGLSAIGVDIHSIRRIFITHAHADHTGAAGVLSRRYDIPIYASRGTWDEIIRRGGFGSLDEKNIRVFDSASGQVDAELESLRVECFPLPHDASEPVGYRFVSSGHTAVVATDIGYVSPEVRRALTTAEVALLEANHDLDMLKNGSYPWPLKRRILSNHGHLSNDAAGILSAELVKSGVRRIYLGHLSHENNRPLLARSAVEERLRAERIDPQRDVELFVAQRDEPSAVTCW